MSKVHLEQSKKLVEVGTGNVKGPTRTKSQGRTGGHSHPEQIHKVAFLVLRL